MLQNAHFSVNIAKCLSANYDGRETLATSASVSKTFFSFGVLYIECAHAVLMPKHLIHKTRNFKFWKHFGHEHDGCTHLPRPADLCSATEATSQGHQTKFWLVYPPTPRVVSMPGGGEYAPRGVVSMPPPFVFLLGQTPKIHN